MGWDDSGNNNRKDPWGGGNRSGGGDDGPPDLDELARKLQERINTIFGGRGGKRSGGSGGNADNSGFGVLAFIIVAIIVVVELFSTIRIIEEGNRGVVLRFGRALDAPLQPGLNFVAPWPIDEVIEIHVDKVRDTFYEGSMLTSDENIVDLELSVQYRIKDAKEYLFQVQDPTLTIQQVTASAIREVVGSNDMDFVIKDGRAAVADQTRDLLQKVLDSYNVGVTVVAVNLNDSKAPAQVQAAFEDAIKAREDEERLKREAETYRNNVLPRARGGAARVLQEAEAYRDSLIATSEGEASRFTQLLEEYEKAPELHRERLYLEAVEEVLGSSSKVLVDVEGNSNPLLYIPLDQLVKQSRGANSNAADPANTTSAPRNSGAVTDTSSRRRRDSRSREIR